jgi:hypothetical protein
MSDKQLAILIARYASLLSVGLSKIDSCGENEQGYKELDELFRIMHGDIESLDGTKEYQRSIGLGGFGGRQ